MNDIAEALKTAGVKIPSQMKRIWVYIKDHPNVSKETLSKALKLKPGNVSSLLTQMVSRNMINRRQDERMTTWKNISKKRLLWVYYTDMIEYHILPVFKIHKPAAPVAQFNKTLHTTCASAVEVTPVTPTPKRLTVGDMKLSEARALYLELKEYFGA